MIKHPRALGAAGDCLVNVELVHGVYVRIENRPGALQNVGRVLGEKKINVDAISCETLGNQGIVRLITTKSKEATAALHHHGIEAFESEFVLVHAANTPGELARLGAELGAADINIEGIVTTPIGRLALRTSDNERAAQILRKL